MTVGASCPSLCGHSAWDARLVILLTCCVAPIGTIRMRSGRESTRCRMSAHPRTLLGVCERVRPGTAPAATLVKRPGSQGKPSRPLASAVSSDDEPDARLSDSRGE
jgi:hypothetical protein